MKRSDLLKEKNYYLLVLSMMVFVMFLSYFLAPIFLLGEGLTPYLTTIAVGLSIGWFIAYFVKELDTATKHPHSALFFVIVIASLLNFSAVHSALLEVSANVPNPFIISVLFSVSFLVPYLTILLIYEK